MAEQRNAGRRVISQADAQAIAAKSGVQRPAVGAKKRDTAATRREFLAIAMAASGALLTVGGLVFLTAPDPSGDPLLAGLVPPLSVDPSSGEKNYPVAGGFAYPRIKANTFGGKFTLDTKASDLKVDDNPQLVAEAVSDGTGANWQLSNLFPRKVLQGDFEPGFRITHMAKDLRIAAEVAGELGLDTPMLALARERLDEARAAFGDDRDYGAVARLSGW